MKKRLGVGVAATMLLLVVKSTSCTSAGSNTPESDATFAPGSGNSLGTVQSSGRTFELGADEEGRLTEIRGADGGSFGVDDSGSLTRLSTSDGGTFDVSRSDDALTVDVDDPEIGELTVMVSLMNYPELTAARRVSSASDSEQGPFDAPRDIKAATLSWRGLDSFEEMDLGTFCQITNACALAELYAGLFLDDVVDEIKETSILPLPRSFFENRVNASLETQRAFCQEWNALVADLDDNPCDSSDDPEPPTEVDCSENETCNVNCPDTEPDPDCSNAEICAAKSFCCIGDQVCDIQRCNHIDPDCTNLDFCDRLGGCCNDDDICQTVLGDLPCPGVDTDCSYCGNADDVCIQNCTPSDPDCAGSESCPTDAFCELECAGEDPDCALCGADETGTCISGCDPQDPDCSVVANITAEGGVSSSSVFNNDSVFAATRGADGSTGTNWFSDGAGGGGPDGDSEVFTWVYTPFSNTSITRIETDPETFEGGGGFGFATAQVLVQDVGGMTVYDSGSLTMSAFRVDLNVALPEGVEGRTVVLTLAAHQDDACGGFSEFRVFGIRDVSEVE